MDQVLKSGNDRIEFFTSYIQEYKKDKTARALRKLTLLVTSKDNEEYAVFWIYFFFSMQLLFYFSTHTYIHKVPIRGKKNFNFSIRDIF